MLEMSQSFSFGRREPLRATGGPHFIIFDRMKIKLVVNTITEFERYWSVNSRVTADFQSEVGYFPTDSVHRTTSFYLFR